MAELKRHEKPLNIVRFSPDGSYIATGGDGKSLRVICSLTITNNIFHIFLFIFFYLRCIYNFVESWRKDDRERRELAV